MLKYVPHVIIVFQIDIVEAFLILIFVFFRKCRIFAVKVVLDFILFE